MQLPLVLRGKLAENLAARGMHQRAVPSFTLEIEDPFILDGEAYPGGKYAVEPGPEIEFVAPK